LRLLFLVQNFRQGWGGAPESARLMANFLKPRGVDCDVFDSGFICSDIGKLTVLPEPRSVFPRFNLKSTQSYDAILLTGPWQNPFHLWRVLAQRGKDQPLYYLPRGGLARIDFELRKSGKKKAYFLAIERRFLDASNGVIFSSEAERTETIAAARGRRPEYVIPDFITAPRQEVRSESHSRQKVVTFGILAEISRRKGLMPLVEAFVAWGRENHLQDGVRLIVGGAPRPGSEGYLEGVSTILRKSNSKNVELRGPVPHSQRDQFYRETDVMVIPSFFESYGLTVIEALAFECALLVAPKVGILEFIPAHESLTIIPGKDVAAIKAGLNQAYLAAIQPDRVRRRPSLAFGQMVADAINSRALRAWTDLLKISDSSV
jgi:glycosyltransferase involved in cell wall biosynthesis